MQVEILFEFRGPYMPCIAGLNRNNRHARCVGLLSVDLFDCERSNPEITGILKHYTSFAVCLFPVASVALFVQRKLVLG